LNTSNRICVALSRARQGMFIVGNGKMLSEKNDVWNAIIEVLKEHNCYGSEIVLQCQNHDDIKTTVSCAADFKIVPDGGCSKRCALDLPCGHKCKYRCHPSDHAEIKCKRRVSFKRDCGHSEDKICHEELGPCEQEIERGLECGHRTNLPCYIQDWESTVRCKSPCERPAFECGHPCPLQCGEKCPKKCKFLVAKALDCGHEVEAECQSNLVNYVCHLPHDADGTSLK